MGRLKGDNPTDHKRPTNLSPMTLKDDLATLRTEFAALRTEVTELRQQMKTLRKFITIEYDEDTHDPIGMNMRCGVIVLTHPDVPNHNQAYIGASGNGPYMLMFDHRNKARVFFGVEKNEPKLVLRSAEVNDAVLLRVDPASGRGLIAALDNGKPRAVMQAANDGSGAISAVHDDGKTRIAMRSEPTGGEILATNAAMKITVKIKADTPFGGMLSISSADGSPGVIVSSNHLGGSIVVNDPEGKPSASLPNADFGTPDEEED